MSNFSHIITYLSNLDTLHLPLICLIYTTYLWLLHYIPHPSLWGIRESCGDGAIFIPSYIHHAYTSSFCTSFHGTCYLSALYRIILTSPSVLPCLQKTVSNYLKSITSSFLLCCVLFWFCMVCKVNDLLFSSPKYYCLTLAFALDFLIFHTLWYINNPWQHPFILCQQQSRAAGNNYSIPLMISLANWFPTGTLISLRQQSTLLESPFWSL